MNFETQDVIAALASPAGSAARAIVRVSGDGSREAVAGIFTAEDAANWNDLNVAFRHAGRLRLAELNVELPAAAYVWPTRRSYTGEPLVELHLPGSPPLVEATLAALYANGVRPARPGEFTLRAFLAGRLDLVQAEAVLGVIDAHDHRELDIALRQLAGGVSGRLTDVRGDLLSLLADLEAGLDFVDEDIEFVSREEVRRRSILAKDAIAALLTDVAERSRDAGRPRVVLAGLPNAGKSTLFNAVCGGERAIVSPVAGTTRDWLTAEVTLSGMPVELVDTAGWETAADDLSLAMQTLRAEQLERADLIVWCIANDATERSQCEDARLRDQLDSGVSERVAGPEGDQPVAPEGGRSLRGHALRDLGPATRVGFDVDSTLLRKTIFVLTKSDLSALEGRQPPEHVALNHGRDSRDASEGLRPPLAVSAKTADGLDVLCAKIARELGRERTGARQFVGSTVARGRQSLKAAHDALERSLVAADLGFDDDVIAAELRSALDGLAAVLGVVYTDDVLDVIFSRFCIGK